MPLSSHTLHSSHASHGSDQLTGLPGRAQLLAQLAYAHQAMVERRLGFAVLAVAPCGLERLRQEHGADPVDRGLLGMAQVFRDSLRGDDGVGHCGEGRFIAYATQMRSDADTLALARRIHDRLRWSFAGAGLTRDVAHVTVNMGLTRRLPCVAESEAAELVQEALGALALAQQSETGALRLYAAPTLLRELHTGRPAPAGVRGAQRWTDAERP